MSTLDLKPLFATLVMRCGCGSESLLHQQRVVICPVCQASAPSIEAWNAGYRENMKPPRRHTS